LCPNPGAIHLQRRCRPIRRSRNRPALTRNHRAPRPALTCSDLAGDQLGARAHYGPTARHTSVPEQRCIKIRRAVVGAVAAYPSAEVFVIYPFRGKRMIGRAGTCRAIVVNPARWNVEAYPVPVVLGETLASNG
jgi:hypothetical protein